MDTEFGILFASRTYHASVYSHLTWIHGVWLRLILPFFHMKPFLSRQLENFFLRSVTEESDCNWSGLLCWCLVCFFYPWVFYAGHLWAASLQRRSLTLVCLHLLQGHHLSSHSHSSSVPLHLLSSTRAVFLFVFLLEITERIRVRFTSSSIPSIFHSLAVLLALGELPPSCCWASCTSF